MFAGFPGGSKVDSGGTGGALELVLRVGGLLRVHPHGELDHEAQPVQESKQSNGKQLQIPSYHCPMRTKSVAEESNTDTRTLQVHRRVHFTFR